MCIDPPLPLAHPVTFPNITDELHVVEPLEEDFLGKISCVLRGRGEPGGLRICFRGGHGLLALDSGLRHVRVPDDVIYTWLNVDGRCGVRRQRCQSGMDPGLAEVHYRVASGVYMLRSGKFRG